MKPLRKATIADSAEIDLAVDHLRKARTLLRKGGAKRAAARARATLKSAEGAQRHIQRALADQHRRAVASN